jgi:hypothetical protein
MQKGLDGTEEQRKDVWFGKWQKKLPNDDFFLPFCFYYFMTFL